MKRAMIKITTPEGLRLEVPAETVATTFISAALAQIGAGQQPAANHGEIPGLGEPWPGEGGCNGGLRRGHDGLGDYYLIVPPGADAETKAAYGGYEHETPGAGSHDDGAANTRALLADDAAHPAAKFAASFTRDGHTDYFLPSRRDIQVAEANVPELFSKATHWTSTQYSADDAYTMGFGGGIQDITSKSYVRLVRPVRRRFI